MSISNKLFVSKFFISAFVMATMLIGYAIFTFYSNEINDEVARALNDSFGHLKGELANL